MREELLKLAERVEQLSGPDREVDALIWLEVTPGATRKETRFIHKASGKEQIIDETRDASRRLIIVPHYTASLDAAMTLVPKTMSLVDLTLSWEPPEPEVFPACSITWYPAAVIHNGKDWHALTASGATPALALCAAALRALAKEK